MGYRFQLGKAAIGTMTYRLTLKETFSLSSGRTVLVGPIEEREGMIAAGTAVILLDGFEHARIEIEGEWLAEKRIHLDQRALSTLTRVELPADWRVRLQP